MPSPADFGYSSCHSQWLTSRNRPFGLSAAGRRLLVTAHWKIVEIVLSMVEQAETQALDVSFQDSSNNRMQRWGERWSQVVAIAIVLNLVLVFFNLTYVPLRQIYLRYVPTVVQLYDPVKSIEPHPVTQNYLGAIAHLRQTLPAADSTIPDRWERPAVVDALADLRSQSTTLIAENPFFASGQVTAFARLKRRMQKFTGQDSAESAFLQFWQADYLQQVGWPTANQFITQRIEPLLQQNYFRETLPTGQYLDNFWRLDIFFSVFFGAELLIRTLLISRTYPNISWGVALTRRWYELPLVIPFWRWLRLLPAAVRLHRTHLVNVENLIGQVTHEPAAYLSDRVSKFAMVRFINQTQTSVRQGSLPTAWQNGGPYTHIGDAEKLDRITDHLMQLVVLQVLPLVKPDLEQLLRHSLRRALVSSEFYDGLQQVPGLDALPATALDGVADYLAQASCDVLTESYTDQEGRILLDNLVVDFRRTLAQELQSSENSAELRTLLSDLLEELKVNYVQQSEQDDPKATLQEVDTLDEQTQVSQSL